MHYVDRVGGVLGNGVVEVGVGALSGGGRERRAVLDDGWGRAGVGDVDALVRDECGVVDGPGGEGVGGEEWLNDVGEPDFFLSCHVVLGFSV